MISPWIVFWKDRSQSVTSGSASAETLEASFIPVANALLPVGAVNVTVPSESLELLRLYYRARDEFGNPESESQIFPMP